MSGHDHIRLPLLGGRDDLFGRVSHADVNSSADSRRARARVCSFASS
jgi:hypothetical protein